jgi:hypothetical protein
MVQLSVSHVNAMRLIYCKMLYSDAVSKLIGNHRMFMDLFADFWANYEYHEPML